MINHILQMWIDKHTRLCTAQSYRHNYFVYLFSTITSISIFQFLSMSNWKYLMTFIVYTRALYFHLICIICGEYLLLNAKPPFDLQPYGYAIIYRSTNFIVSRNLNVHTGHVTKIVGTKIVIFVKATSSLLEHVSWLLNRPKNIFQYVSLCHRPPVLYTDES